MGERREYAPGTFCWADLATVDLEGATAFYRELLGWEARDDQMAPGVVYRTMLVEGRPVCALFAMGEEQRSAGIPPAWLSYVSVENVDAAAARATALGASLVQAPLDVLDAGRMAVLRDPQGTVVAVWEPRAHQGAALVNDPGAICLNQLNVPDPEAAGRFYAELFGWTISQVAADPMPYWGIQNAGRLNGGMMGLPPGDGAPPHWLVYFTAADLDAAATLIGAQGGGVLMDPLVIESGRVLVARDPQGAVFGLFEGDVDP